MYHTMCKLSGINKMIIFGGSDSDTSAFNTVHTFDLVLEVWELAIPVSAGSGGSVPSARKGHSAVCLNNTMVVYGGGTDNPLDDDVWVMDASVTPWVWNRMTVNKQLGPGSRMGHSALLNGTNILVWGGYGSPLANDTNIYILDTVAWQWSSSKDLGSFAPMPPSDSGNVSGSAKNHLPLTIGVVCGSLVLIASFTAYIILRRRGSKKTQGKAKHTQDSASMLSDAEQYLSEDLGLDDKPSYYNQYTGRDSGSSLGGWPTMAGRRSITLPAQGYPMRSMTSPSPQESATLTDASTKEANPRRSGSRRSMDLQKLQRAQIAHQTTLQDPDPSLQELHQQQQQLQQQQHQPQQHPGVRNGSISSDPFYPAHLAENDEEDADRWTFASSLSFDQREKSGSIPALRYIPSRPAATATPGSGFSRVAMRSTGNLTPNYAASRAPRRDGSAPSILSRHASSIGAGSVSLAGTPAAATPIGTQDTALFNSVSPLDRVSLMCSTLDVASQVSVEEEPVSAARLRPGTNLNQWRDSYQRGSFVSTTVDGEAEEVEEEEEESHITSRPSGSASTGRTFAASSHLENTTLATLIQNLPARYLVSQSPLPIHGASNDILFAVDSDTQRPIVIKSFLRREAWERECRMLRRLRGPCIVELKHVATLALSETDEPSNKHAKIRLTILERLDETLAEMLKNAREAKKVALREHAAAVSAASASEEEEETETAQGFSLGPAAELYRTGPALDETHIKDIVKGVLRCLAWCHSKKVVYCDLQPTNIMRNRDDPRRQWKLIDLEASRTAEEERTTVGTARYCPPEVAAAWHATTTTTTSTTGVTAQYSMDLWAFGCLLY
ncbi:F-box only protein 42, partial [Dissophora globulifera]